MMNLGDDKGVIIKDTIENYKPKTILEVGTYVGYSSVFMAYHSKGTIHTFDPNKNYSSIAEKIHKHAGVTDSVKFHQGTIQDHEDFIKKHGAFDMIFIDHWK
jgi:catechol O-methyltransferase